MSGMYGGVLGTRYLVGLIERNPVGLGIKVALLVHSTGRELRIDRVCGYEAAPTYIIRAGRPTGPRSILRLFRVWYVRSAKLYRVQNVPEDSRRPCEIQFLKRANQRQHSPAHAHLGKERMNQSYKVSWARDIRVLSPRADGRNQRVTSKGQRKLPLLSHKREGCTRFCP